MVARGSEERGEKRRRQKKEKGGGELEGKWREWEGMGKGRRRKGRRRKERKEGVIL